MRLGPSTLQVRQQFRPEFINRIDEFIVFQALDRTQIMHIVRLQVGPTPGRMSHRRMPPSKKSLQP